MKRIIFGILSVFMAIAGYVFYIRYVDTSVISIGIQIDPTMQHIYSAALKTDGKGRVTVLGEQTVPLDETLKWLLQAQSKGIQALETTPTVCAETYRQTICQLTKKLGLKANAVHVVGADQHAKLLVEKMGIIGVDNFSPEERKGIFYVQALVKKPVVILNCDTGATITVMRDGQVQHLSFDTVDNMIGHIHRIEGKVPLIWLLWGESWQNPILRQYVAEQIKKKVSTSVEIKLPTDLGLKSPTISAQILAYQAVRRLKKFSLSTVPGQSTQSCIHKAN